MIAVHEIRVPFFDLLYKCINSINYRTTIRLFVIKSTYLLIIVLPVLEMGMGWEGSEEGKGCEG